MNELNQLLHPTLDEIDQASVDLAKRIKQETYYLPDVVVGINRGGLIPAVLISHELDIPHIPVSYSSKEGKGNNRNHTNVLPAIDVPWKHIYVLTPTTKPTVLVVDDICDSGHTLSEVASYYIQQGHIVHTAVLYYKEIKNPPIQPKFFWRRIPEDSNWIIFPWERS